MEQRNCKKWNLILVIIFILIAVPAGNVFADEATDAKIEKLQENLLMLQKEIEQLKHEKIDQQDRRLEQLENQKQDISNFEGELSKLRTNYEGQTSDKDFRVYWADGLRFKTRDDSVELRIGGRIHNDWTFITESDQIKEDIGEQEDGVQFRRARFYLRGQIYDDIDFQMQYDFAGQEVAFRDLYMRFLKFPLGRLTVGQFKEPFSLDELTSSNNITFIERATPTVFAPSRNMGFMLNNTAFDQRMTWAAGIFRPTSDRLRSDGGYNATGRVTFAPIYENKGEHVLHLGSAYTYKTPANDTFRFRQRPEAGLTDRFTDTGDFAADNAGVVGLEAAWVNGPFSLQSEYIRAQSDGTNGQADRTFDGWYVQGSYWLTGEHRNYSRSSGTFGSVKPKRNFGQDGGWGAWEIAARYSSLDLSEGPGANAGKLNTITAGLNCHLNPNARLMANYVHADRDLGGNAGIYMMRFQLNF